MGDLFRLAALAAVLCALPARADAPAKRKRRKVDFSATTTPPIRRACAIAQPRLHVGDSAHGKLTLDYGIAKDGRVTDVAVAGNANEGAVRAVREFIQSCVYEPATQDGKAVAVRWTAELVFPR